MIWKTNEINELINNECLEQIDSYKYLGVKPDSRLEFKMMLKEIFQAVHHTIYILSKIRSCHIQRTALTIFKCKILPYINFADILYNGIDRVQTKQLQFFQNKCLWIAHKLTIRTNVDYLHINNKLLHIDNRRILHLLTYKCIRSVLTLHWSIRSYWICCNTLFSFSIWHCTSWFDLVQEEFLLSRNNPLEWVIHWLTKYPWSFSFQKCFRLLYT